MLPTPPSWTRNSSRVSPRKIFASSPKATSISAKPTHEPGVETLQGRRCRRFALVDFVEYAWESGQICTFSPSTPTFSSQPTFAVVQVAPSYRRPSPGFTRSRLARAIDRGEGFHQQKQRCACYPVVQTRLMHHEMLHMNLNEAVKYHLHIGSSLCKKSIHYLHNRIDDLVVSQLDDRAVLSLIERLREVLGAAYAVETRSPICTNGSLNAWQRRSLS